MMNEMDRACSTGTASAGVNRANAVNGAAMVGTKRCKMATVWSG